MFFLSSFSRCTSRNGYIFLRAFLNICMEITKSFFFSGKIGKKKPRKNNKLLEDNFEGKMQFQFQCCFIFFLLQTLNEAFSFTEISHIRFAFISYFSFLTIHLTQAPNLLLFWSLMMLLLLLLYLCVHKIFFFLHREKDMQERKLDFNVAEE